MLVYQILGSPINRDLRFAPTGWSG